jgi:hypothetical protein
MIASIDMTLGLAAESYLKSRERNANPHDIDPWGRDCFINLVDLKVNSTLFLPQRSLADYAWLPIFVNRIGGLTQLPNCAKMLLEPAIERKILRRFWRMTEAIGHRSIVQWWRSQLLSSSVLAYQRARRDQRSAKMLTISNEGLNAWKSYSTAKRQRELPAEHLPELASRADHVINEVQRFDSLSSYIYCYAFDVYRRGWQYNMTMEEKDLDISYCPHPLRENAIAKDSQARLARQQYLYWSWGQRLAHLIDRSGHVDISQVEQWILGLHEARPPQWIGFSTLIEGGDSASIRKAARSLIDVLHDCARRAEIPKQFIGTGRLEQVGELALEAGREFHHVGLWWRALQVVPVGNKIRRLCFGIAETAMDGANLVCKNTFGHPGLIGIELGKRAGPSGLPAYLV